MGELAFCRPIGFQPGPERRELTSRLKTIYSCRTVKKAAGKGRADLLVTIGWSNNTAFDLVDSNICIATAQPKVEQVKTYDPVLIPVPDPYYVKPMTTNLESDDFDFTPTAGNYEVIVNFACFDDTGTIGGIKPTGGPSSCTLLNEIYNTVVPVNQVTVVSNHLRIPVTATDDPVCKNVVGWNTITITWQAWPSQ